MPVVVMQYFALLAALTLATPAAAQLPEDACYALQMTPADLAARPERGVRALYVHFIALTDLDASNKGPWRHLRISALMAAQGQGLRDGAAGALLTQVAECRTEQQGECWAYDDASMLSLTVHDGQTLELRTQDFIVADFGESMMASNLAETIGRESIYSLTRLNNGPCPVE